MSEVLAKASRPRRFGDVVGQEHPVRYLSGLATRGRVGRHILLHGTVGSGKTTLARIYGQALLCTAPIVGDGSPCRACEACLKVENEEKDCGFYEYDVSGTGGGIAQISNWLEATSFAVAQTSRRVLFLDEAHGLTDDAASGLLKEIEESTGNVVFIFATSEHHNLSAALRSRLVPLKVRPLRMSDATQLLRRVASERELEYDDDALVMLASMVVGQPRDLLNALDQVAVYRERISLATLRNVFDFEYLDSMRAYLLALGDRDESALNHIVSTWRDTAEEKVRWVLALLAGMYMQDVLGIAADVDPVLDGLRIERNGALEKLRKHHGITNNFALASYWRRLLGHWRSELIVVDEATIEAQFVSFHSLICATDASQRPQQSAQQELGDRQSLKRSANTGSGFLEIGQAKQILDLASFLTQNYALYFNALFVLKATDGAGPRREQSELAGRFCSALEEELCQLGSDRFAALWTLEGSPDGIVAYVATHVPESIGIDLIDGLQHVRLWYRSWRAENDHATVSLQSRDTHQDRAAFHWKIVKEQLGALHPSVVAEDRDGVLTPLRELLSLPRARRDAAVAPEPIVQVSGLLRANLIAIEAELGIVPLSAFDDLAWSFMFKGWEIDEFEDRHRERLRRERQLVDLVGLYPDTEERSRQEALLRQGWPKDPHAYSRTWQKWW